MTSSTNPLSRAVARMFTKRVQIIETKALTRDLILLTLEGSAFRSVAWTAGDKLQIAMGSLFNTRTYTPIDWDSDLGRTSIIGFTHGIGPGCTWLREARAGDWCDVLGPRHSLDMRRIIGPIAMFGDETSLGLAAVIHGSDASAHSFHFEISDRKAVGRLVDQWGLRQVDLVVRTANSSHLAELEAPLAKLAADGATFVLTGSAPTIQHIRANLKHLGVTASRMQSKVYWAPGKTGLD